MTQQLVSIVVPCYNAGPWLEETLESVRNQSWPRVQTIVVNDGSTDNTLAIARRYEGPGLQIVSQANRGLSAARNAGLRLAQGDYIQFLDADDLLAPAKIAVQVELLNRSPAGTVAIGRWARFRRDPSRARFSPSAYWRDLGAEEYLAEVAATGNTVPVHAWLLPRKIVDDIGPFAEDLRVMEDHEYFARVVLRASGMRYADGACCYYRSFHAKSLSRLRDHSASRSMLRCVELIESHLLADRGDTARRSIAADYYQWLIYKLYPNHPDLMAVAKTRVEALGGSRLRPLMGRRARALARIFGWKAVQRLRAWLWSRDIYLGKDDFISD